MKSTTKDPGVGRWGVVSIITATNTILFNGGVETLELTPREAMRIANRLLQAAKEVTRERKSR